MPEVEVPSRGHARRRTNFRNLPSYPSLRQNWSRMPSNSISQKGQRGARVKLGGSILAVLVLENGRQIRSRMSQLSINGGLLSLEKPLDEGIRVTVVFHLGITSVRSRAQMLFPMWATKGCLQPFRFLELADDSRMALNRELAKLVSAGAPQEEEDSEVSG